MKCLPFKNCVVKDAPKGSVTQWFGENYELYYNNVIINGEHLMGHNGIDLVSTWGTPLLAVDDGYICDMKADPTGYGMHVRIMTPDNVEWTYGHMSRIDVKRGQKVLAGDVLGAMGNTGFVVSSSDGNGFWEKGTNKYAGTHLHFGKRQYKNGQPLQYENGFWGAIDFGQELEDCWMKTQVDLISKAIELCKQILLFWKK